MVASTNSSSDPIIGVQKGLKDVFERIKLVASTGTPVLLLGETGSGKEVVARTIHEMSLRKKKEFVRVNCGAITASLIDSELFGHEKGSFTGAETKKLGWFERADGGSLLLDEIGEMPLSVQTRLLRVLQDGTFDRVGGQHTIKVDVRIIAATHRDLATMVKNKEFREDLWYRLSTFPIRIPSVRERLEDLSELTDYFLNRSANRIGLPVPSVSELDLGIIKGYAWPGNVRELEAVVTRALILGRGRTFEVGKALGIGQEAVETRESGRNVISILPGEMPHATLDQAVKAHIESTLEKTLGRIEGPFGAAKILEIHPNTLRSRMKKLGINPSVFKKSGS